uniref:Uncharacterized protein n=1 Tax=Arundo donax TaxID=35708 RepID=A0A0A8ZKS0_ARUDO
MSLSLATYSSILEPSDELYGPS